ESIERSFESVGVRIGTLLPASLALFEGFSALLSARARGDYALIHRAPGSFVFLVAKDAAPIFFRQRPSDEAQRDHEQEIRLSLSYYADKLGGKGLAAAFTHDATPSESNLAEALPIPLEPLSGRLFGSDASFDQMVGARPELLPAFAAVYAEEADANLLELRSPAIPRRRARFSGDRGRPRACGHLHGRQCEVVCRLPPLRRRDHSGNRCAPSAKSGCGPGHRGGENRAQQLSRLEPRTGEPRSPAVGCCASLFVDWPAHATRTRSSAGRAGDADDP